MEQSEAPLDDLAEAILDGRPVDWLAVEAESSGPSGVVIRQLRVIADLANLHRTIFTRSSGDQGSGALDYSEEVVANRWGPLLLHECVGQGAFGQVFRAWDTRLDREVALKLLAADTDATTLDATVINEGRLLARIRHPNVVAVYGAERINGRVGIWTEFVHGRTLEQLLHRDGPFDVKDATTIGVEVCRALAAVHDAGLLHRDVKAQNVMREDGGRIVLMDLGAGTERLIEQAGWRLDIAGTPLYLAPEILEGDAATVQSDLYSVGVMLYHLVTGSFPLHAQSLEAVRVAHRESSSVPLSVVRPDLPPAFVRVIERALDRVPDRRYASATALEAALREAMPTEGGRAAGPAQVKRWLLASAAATVAAIALTSGNWMRGERGLADAERHVSTAEPGMRRVTVPPMGLFRAGSPSFDGRFYVNTDEFQDLMLFDLTGGAVRRLTNHGDSSEQAQFSVISPDGRAIAYQWETKAGMELRVINGDGTNMRVLVPAGRSIRPIEWSRDGAQVLCLLDQLPEYTRLVMVRASDGVIREVAQLRNVSPQRISLSPDNAFVVYDSPAGDASRRHDVFILPTSGGPASTLISHPADDVSPLWTPDGRHVFFVSDRSGTIDGWVVPVSAGIAHGEPVMVARNLGRVALSGFTASGTLYYWLQTGDMDVFTASIDPGNAVKPERIISRFAGANSGAAWSPDGRRFAYISQRSRLSGEATGVIVVRDLPSNDEREITPALSRVGPVPLRWSPDGRSLIVRGSRADGQAGAFVLDVESGHIQSAITVDSAHLSDVGQTRWWLDSRSVGYLSPRGLIAKDLRSGVEQVVLDQAALRPPLRVTSFDVSPDRRTLAFTAVIVGGQPAVRVLSVMPLGGTARELVRVIAPEQIFLQSWMPGGRDLLMTRWNPSERGPHQLLQVSAADGSVRETDLEIPGFTQVNLVQVNPTGTQIAYTANGPQWDLWRIENFLPEPRR